MKTVTHVIKHASRKDRFRIYHLTDLHIGAANCDEDALHRTIQTIKNDPNAYWIGGGDYMDAISRKGDYRHTEGIMAKWLWGVDDILGEQVRYAIKMLAPIAHQCLGMVIGNHEESVIKHDSRDMYRDLVYGIAAIKGCKPEELALGWEGFIRLVFRRGKKKSWRTSYIMTIYVHHGAGGGRTAGSPARNLERTMTHYSADLFLLGHRHVRQILSLVITEPKGSGSVAKERLGIQNGSFLKPYLDKAHDGMPRYSYPQSKQLYPATVGVVPVEVWPDRRWFSALISNQPSIANIAAD